MSTAFVHFKFIDKSAEVLGNVQCNSADPELIVCAEPARASAADSEELSPTHENRCNCGA
jgi:hypothetical protein